MNNKEIELKLLINNDFAHFLSQELSNFKILKQTQSLLGNCYYDSHDFFFSKMKSGLRVRTENHQFTMTLKLDGESTGGLHIRPEYNVPLSSAKPDILAFKQFTEISFQRSLEELQAELKPIFSTDFLRQTWLIELANGAVIETALDQGTIIAGEKREEINEVEFELHQGTVQDLITFVQNLSLNEGVRLSARSKAERGYALAGITPVTPLDFMAKWRTILDLKVEKREFLTALLQYEQLIADYTATLIAEDYRNNLTATTEVLGAFFCLYQHYYNATEIVNPMQITAKDNLYSSVEYLQETNTRFYQQIKQMIAEHVNHKDNQQAIKQIQALIAHPNYALRILHLLKIII